MIELIKPDLNKEEIELKHGDLYEFQYDVDQYAICILLQISSTYWSFVSLDTPKKEWRRVETEMKEFLYNTTPTKYPVNSKVVITQE